MALAGAGHGAGGPSARQEGRRRHHQNKETHMGGLIVLIVLALTYAGHTWGLGRTWARLPFVHHHPWTI